VVYRLVAVLLLCSTSLALAQARPKAHETLELSIRTDRTTYTRNNSVELQLQVTNYGHNDLYLWKWDFCWNFSRGLTLHVLSEDGKEINPGPVMDCVPPPPNAGHPEDFIRIGSGAFYGTITDLKISNFFPKPGNYALFVTYDSSLPAGFRAWFPIDDPATKIPVRLMGDPTLTSNRLRITIEE
jgi:hypothetical protein